jgi:hypothetical protein
MGFPVLFQSGSLASRTVTSTAALPWGGSLTAANAIAVGSIRPLPWGAVTAFTTAIVVEEGPPERLPWGGVVTLVLPIAAQSVAARPLGGTIVLVGQVPVLPTSGWDDPRLAKALRRRRPRRRQPVEPLPTVVFHEPEPEEDWEAIVGLLLLS